MVGFVIDKNPCEITCHKDCSKFLLWCYHTVMIVIMTCCGYLWAICDYCVVVLIIASYSYPLFMQITCPNAMLFTGKGLN